MTDAGETRPPLVGTWYRDPLERCFEVVAVDQESGVVQVRYEEGEDAELTLADWRHVMIDRDGAPDDFLTSSDVDEEA